MRIIAIVAGAVAAVSPALAADWLQFGYDSQHSCVNPLEYSITRDNVASLSPIYSVTLPAQANASPVYLSNVQTSTGVKDLLFVTSLSGSLIAIDAADGSVIWMRPQPYIEWQHTDSSPAIDPNREYVYGYALDGKVHKYQVADGTEITTQGWPQIVTVKPVYEHVASALSIATDADGKVHLYAVTSGYYGDFGDYQGHLTAIDLASGEQKVFNANCSDLAIHFLDGGEPGVTDCATRLSGIWGRPGAIYDAAKNRIYISTANGEFDANVGGHNWGDSVLALSTDGSGQIPGLPLDSFTPANYEFLENSDLDLGAASLALIPAPPESAYQHLGAQMGKDGVLHLINLDNMNGTGVPGAAGGDLQTLTLSDYLDNPIPQPAVWIDPVDQSTWVFVAEIGHSISALRLKVDASGIPSLEVRWTKPANQDGPMLANGILFYASAALDPTTGNSLAYVGPDCCYWGTPIIVNGKVFAVNYQQLTVYGLDRIFRDGFD